MLYPDLFKSLEEVRWDFSDIHWTKFEPAQLTDEQAQTIKLNAITEWSALPATEMFLRDNKHDGDFCAFISVWFYEEQKHSLVLMEYLRRFRPDLLPTDAELAAVRFDFDPAPPLETLAMHFCGEVRLNHWYRCAMNWHTEPVIQSIYAKIATDEARHAGAYLKYMKRAIELDGDAAKYQFAKICTLMTSSSHRRKPLHPTNLHVNAALFPNDTIQSHLPDPEWLSRWLDEQIEFDSQWEERVLKMIFYNLANLLDTSITSSADLSRYRKQFTGAK